MMSETSNELINEQRLNKMKYEILKVEDENLKTQSRTNDSMVELIMRIITDEVKKTY